MQKAEGRRQNEEIRLKSEASARMTWFAGRLGFFRGRGPVVSGCQGFTLIEVLIAITVFSVGILAVAAMQSHSTSSNARAMLITRATTLAAEQVEEMQGWDFNGAYLTGGAAPVKHDPGVDAGLPPDPPGFDLSWQVTNDIPMPGVKQIVVTVTSTSGPATTTNLTYYKVRTY